MCEYLRAFRIDDEVAVILPVGKGNEFIVADAKVTEYHERKDTITGDIDAHYFVETLEPLAFGMEVPSDRVYGCREAAQVGAREAALRSKVFAESLERMCFNMPLVLGIPGLGKTTPS